MKEQNFKEKWGSRTSSHQVQRWLSFCSPDRGSSLPTFSPVPLTLLVRVTPWEVAQTMADLVDCPLLPASYYRKKFHHSFGGVLLRRWFSLNRKMSDISMEEGQPAGRGDESDLLFTEQQADSPSLLEKTIKESQKFILFIKPLSFPPLTNQRRSIYTSLQSAPWNYWGILEEGRPGEDFSKLVFSV